MDQFHQISITATIPSPSFNNHVHTSQATAHCHRSLSKPPHHHLSILNLKSKSPILSYHNPQTKPATPFTNSQLNQAKPVHSNTQPHQQIKHGLNPKSNHTTPSHHHEPKALAATLQLTSSTPSYGEAEVLGSAGQVSYGVGGYGGSKMGCRQSREKSEVQARTPAAKQEMTPEDGGAALVVRWSRVTSTGSDWASQ
ncbi:hypothetical protein M0R45_010175 [Rubus argutus]|uniref:Uncharacterized protein n=1 Tax=Rubus argutus TaxID=59490 RepID=A0AAW1Y6B3_RUBAR